MSVPSCINCDTAALKIMLQTDACTHCYVYNVYQHGCRMASGQSHEVCRIVSASPVVDESHMACNGCWQRWQC